MKPTIQLDSKDVRMIVSKFLGIPLEDVIPQRYGYAISGMSAEEIEKRIYTDNH